jgi:hypothetical protein
MSPNTIEITLEPDLVRIYEIASQDEKERVRFWISLLLQDMKQDRRISLLEAMDNMAREAQARGLTPEILEELLKDDDTE